MKNEIGNILKSVRPEIDLNTSQNFIENGDLDSFDIAALITHFDAYFEIKILGINILPEYFTSVDAMHKLIKKYRHD